MSWDDAKHETALKYNFSYWNDLVEHIKSYDGDLDDMYEEAANTLAKSKVVVCLEKVSKKADEVMSDAKSYIGSPVTSIAEDNFAEGQIVGIDCIKTWIVHSLIPKES